ncbi:hypothetical protein LCGC14_2721640 [marine sediment metagenome]|uniref:Crossover junction endodeoxyribonuclease RusA n=1 Tax=marine sediment metagenome TaxID=412755 RepID=A0A0F9C1N8_9ZZZZ
MTTSSYSYRKTGKTNAERHCRLTLPFPPSVNHYWVPNGRGGRRISNKGRVYRADVEAVVFDELRGWEAMTGPLRVTVTATMPDRRKRDVDNLFKAPLDALEHCRVFEDDNQVYRLLIERVAVEKPGHIVVEITQDP